MNSYQFIIITPPAPFVPDTYNGFVDAETPEEALKKAIKKSDAWRIDFCEIREPNKKNKLLVKGYCDGRKLIEISKKYVENK